MITRRDWLLQQLGITQWILRHPAVFQGKITVNVPNNVRLLLVANSSPPVDHPLIVDVARSLSIMPTQLYALTPKQVMMLPEDVYCYHCWWIGLESLRDFDGLSLVTPPLASLEENAKAKRVLWRQISRNEHYLNMIVRSKVV